MRASGGSALVRYCLAVLATGLATALTITLWTTGGSVFPFFFLAIVTTAWVAGREAAFLTTFLSAVAAAWFLLPPYGTFRLSSVADLATVAVFMAAGALV